MKLESTLCTLLITGAYAVLIVAVIRWAINLGLGRELLIMAGF